MRFELYVDHPALVDDTAAFLGKDSAIDGLVVMAETSDGKLRVRSAERAAELRGEAGELPVTFAVWPDSKPREYSHLGSYCADIEGQFKSYNRPVAISKPGQVRYVTTYPNHRLVHINSYWKARPGTPLELQCYPIAGGDLESRTELAVDYCLDRARDKGFQNEVQIALPLWGLASSDGTRKNGTSRAFLVKLVRRCHTLGITTVRFWSAKHALPELGGISYAKQFLLVDLPILKREFSPEAVEKPSPVATNVATRLGEIWKAIDDRDYRYSRLEKRS